MEKTSPFLYSTDIQLRVRYGETDQMGYCYYGNYAQYFEVGRVEVMRSLGMSYKKMESEGFMLPVLDFKVKYISPAYYDDLLTVTTFISKLEGVRMSFSYEIKNDSGKLISTGETAHVFVKKTTMKPSLPPSFFLELINSQKINFQKTNNE